MKRHVIYTEDEYKQLAYNILECILNTTKRGYGCKFISRETKKEMEDMEITGLLIPSIEKGLNL